MPDSFRSDHPPQRRRIGSISHARRLIRVGYAPDAVRGMLCLEPTDALWVEVQAYYEERKRNDGNRNS